tara:strand:+ start:25566 stop:26474 length:909 start_codon:yes stop_codon:yes gene_type:complete
MENKFNIYEHITNRVIKGLKSDGLKWFRPWRGGSNNPINHKSEVEYKGFNIFWLNMVCEEAGYENNEWLTYKQGQELGYTLKKGSKAGDQFVIYWMVSYLHDGKWYSENQLKKMGIKKSACKESWNMRYYNVFNIAQFEESIEAKRKPVVATEFNPIEEAEKVLRNYEGRPSLRHGGDRAFYRPSNHHVQMPKRNSFVTPDDYYKTLFHELTHSTGHKSILNRKGVMGVNNFGDESYSQEELVAELGSEYLVGLTGLDPKDNETNSQAYINGFIANLEDSDPKHIIYASQQAMKAVNRILKK